MPNGGTGTIASFGENRNGHGLVPGLCIVGGHSASCKACLWIEPGAVRPLGNPPSGGQAPLASQTLPELPCPRRKPRMVQPRLSVSRGNF